MLGVAQMLRAVEALLTSLGRLLNPSLMGFSLAVPAVAVQSFALAAEERASAVAVEGGCSATLLAT